MATGVEPHMCARHEKLLEACCECIKDASDEELERFKLAVEYATDHIIMTDPSGIVIYANKAAETTTGYSREEMLGKTPALWGRQMEPAYYADLWETIGVRRQQYFGELKNKRKNGIVYEAEVHIAPVLSEDGSVRFYVGIERDITDVKNLARAKTEFISLASHNLKTPLSSASWYCEMLLNGDVGALTDKQREYVGEVSKASKLMTDLVSSLLNISRIDLGTYSYAVESCDMEAILRRVIDEFTTQTAGSGITFSIIAEPNVLPVASDCVMLENVLRNLLSNSIKYSHPGGTITVRLFDKPAGEEVYGKTFREDRTVVVVSDCGIGIPEGDQGKVFTQFFRGSNTGEIRAGGTGLGMYLVQSVVTAVGGDIWFSSKEGQGSEFYLALPYDYTSDHAVRR